MAETPDDLKQNIETARARISGDIHELEYRIQRATDWRSQLRQHGRAIVAGVFALGFLIAFISGRRR